MQVIYEPRGKAREYCELAANLYNGCSHGCLYCYAPAVLFKTREQFKLSYPRKSILQFLKKEAPGYCGREVLLSFTSDPYQKIENTQQITRTAIKIMHSAGIIVNILTKGGKRSERDFDLLVKNKSLSKYGSTLTFVSNKDSLEWEPGAALPEERFSALKLAHDLGIITWASLEPVIDPEQTLAIIRSTHSFVDLFKVGRWNHDRRASAINWSQFAKKAKGILDSLEKKYYIKKDLAMFLK